MKVLLVSSNPALTRRVESALAGRPDTEVAVVATPGRALGQLDGAAPFDVVVADNDTHPAGGFSLARDVRARANMGLDVPPVVLLLARHQDAWLANWAQADAYLVKPVDPFDLAEVVDALVAGEEVPALPGVGSNPTPSLLDLPAGGRKEAS